MPIMSERTPIQRAHLIVATLATIEEERATAEREQRPIYRRFAASAADHLESSLGESPSIARIRAALILLAGVTDEDLVPLLYLDLDRLNDLLRRIEDGEV